MENVIDNEIILIHYVQFDILKQEINHILKVKSANTYTNQIIKVSSMDYEDVWQLLYVYISA